MKLWPKRRCPVTIEARPLGLTEDDDLAAVTPLDAALDAFLEALLQRLLLLPEPPPRGSVRAFRGLGAIELLGKMESKDDSTEIHARHPGCKFRT